MPFQNQYPGLQSVGTAGRTSQYRSGLGQQFLARDVGGDQGAYQIAAQSAAGASALKRQALVTGAGSTDAALGLQGTMLGTALTNAGELARTQMQGEVQLERDRMLYQQQNEQDARNRRATGMGSLLGGAARFAGAIWAGPPKFTPPAAPPPLTPPA